MLDLGRVISVSEIGSSRTFHLGVSGARQIYFEAADHSRIALERLYTDRAELMRAWEAFRNSRPRGKGTIVQLSTFHINLLAVAAVSDIERCPIGMSCGSVHTHQVYRFHVHVMGLDDALKLQCPEDDVVALASFRKSHDDLLDAWRRIHEPEAA